LFKKDYGVSHIVGYMLTLSITSLVLVTLIFITTGEIDGKYLSAAEIYAEDLSNQIADFVVNICLMKETYENANYSINLDIPTQLVDRYSYYIEIDNSKVYVNSSDGRISKNSTLYDIPQRLNIKAIGRVEGTNKLTIFSNKSDYIYKFDFGTNMSYGFKGYTRVTDECIDTGWRDANYKYRTPINIYNPLSVPISDYQILIQINENNFDYSLADRNGSDLKFFDSSDRSLYYWIERWDPDDEKTSRVWINVYRLEPGWNKIYMYHGNPSALPESSGEKTFIFFDDFTNGLNKWTQYKPPGGEIVNLDDDKLLITNRSAVVNTILELTPASEPVVIEAKAYASSVSAREASMFVRSLGGVPPYKSGHVFSSGNFPGGVNNLTILYYDAGWTNASPSKGMPAMVSDWYRLRYILNGNDDCIARYYYDNFVVDGLNASDFGECDDGYFGLCVINSQYNTRAIYDWVYVRKFVGNTTLKSGGRDDFEPIAYVDGTQSQNFYWDNLDDVKSGLLVSSEYDYIYNADDSSATFEIKNIPEGVYSLTFVVGLAQETIDNVTITADGTGGINPVSQKIYYWDSYKRVLLSNVQVDANQILQITFDDEDTISDFWSVGEMTVEKGDRSIKLEGMVR
jgi:hypothetical protein